MKRLLLLCLVIICCGCQPAIGSFHDESLNLEVLSVRIDENISTKQWHMSPLLMTQSLEEADIIYGIDDMHCAEVLIRRSLIDAACDEIAVFHAKEGSVDFIVQQLQEYQKQRIQAYDQLPNQQMLLQNAAIINYGNYVLLVCSKDQANVLQYMSSLAQ